MWKNSKLNMKTCPNQLVGTAFYGNNTVGWSNKVDKVFDPCRFLGFKIFYFVDIFTRINIQLIYLLID